MPGARLPRGRTGIPLVLGSGALLLLFSGGGIGGAQEASVTPMAEACDGFASRSDAPIHWVRPEDPDERDELDRWCRAVGSPVVHRPEEDAGRGPAGAASSDSPPSAGRPPPAPAPPGAPAPSANANAAPSSLALVAWNVNVGRGHLDLLVEDLVSGRLTGEPVEHFVLLLQEVFRAGAAVPSGPDAGSRSADRIGSDEDRSAPGDIVRFARERGLHLFYAPSMRNGRDDPEDRGNAILSTLPLADLEVVELPVQRQRRAAVAATVEGIGGGAAGLRGGDASANGASDGGGLRVVSVHLDHFSGWDRMHRSLGQDRERHARRLVAAFGDEESIAIGGDFNTWLGGNEEPAIRLMRAHFPDPAQRPTEGTYEASFFPFNRLLDHLFFRVPEGWEADYHVAPSVYGSDHRPLVGTIRIPRPDGGGREEGSASLP